MAEAPQFSPEELDRLEDALESIEGMELDLIEDESPAVRERLVDYRAILIASRDALPMQDVPEGALDRVLSIAADPGQDELAAALPSDEPQPSWWTRFRRTLLIPTLAVAGSAALILVIVQALGFARARGDRPSPVPVDANDLDDGGRAEPSDRGTSTASPFHLRSPPPSGVVRTEQSERQRAAEVRAPRSRRARRRARRANDRS